VAGLIVGGAWLETSRLREDGALVARRLGAVAIDPIADPLHRRMQNLLEELAIAARVGVPRAFVLEDEPSINALTAGLDRNQAVVVVTRGALSRLTRDELQGVLAHEVSHIVNGDVRLNTRLLGLNHGLQLVAMMGRSLLGHAAGRSGPLGLLLAVPLLLTGAVIAVIGSIGSVAARAIQAGVERQREYFADAHAVAVTRQRDGLGGALRKVAGEALVAQADARAAMRGGVRLHPYWRNVAPLMISGESDGGWFDTHPPIAARVRRLYGGDRAPIVPTDLAGPDRREPDLPAMEFAIAAAALQETTDGAAPSDTLAPFAARRTPCFAARRLAGTAEPAGADWPETRPVEAVDRARAAGAGRSRPDPFAPTAASTRLVQATRDPASAAALVIALIEPAGEVRSPDWDEGWRCAEVPYRAVRGALAELSDDTLRRLRWPLIELAVVRLRPLSRPSRDALLSVARSRIRADGRVTLREWLYFGLLRLRLTPRPAPLRLPVLDDPIDARSVRVLFALVAQCVQVSEAKADRAANAAIRALDLVPIGGSSGPLTLDALDGALRRAARLPPLARPLLVRRLVGLLPSDADAEVLDLLRLLCVAIDCPPPAWPTPRDGSAADLADDTLADAGA
jgi:Zn-dependent protease with chaperone function